MSREHLVEHSHRDLRVDCCIVGGGPAGMMLGLLLARAGLEVAVLEKHNDFLRDFRGDTIHPSTMEILSELGLLERFMDLPHQEMTALRGRFGTTELTIAELTGLPTICPFIAFMPQWNFLDFLTEEARRFPGFQLFMETAATDLVTSNDAVIGVCAKGPGGELRIQAPLTVGADGRHSLVRERAGFARRDLGSPIDVLWFRLPRSPGSGHEAFANMQSGRMVVTINRGDYWQCAYVIPKGGASALEAAGIEALRQAVGLIVPDLKEELGRLVSWEEVKLLSVSVDRLRDWSRPGLLCIGDAAHAMSPVGGVGINLAIQDAVATANVVCAPLKSHGLTPAHLRLVQRRRTWPTVATQFVQLNFQNRFLAPGTDGHPWEGTPLPFRLLSRSTWLRRLLGRIVGLGFRPESVKTPLQAVAFH